MSKPWPDEVRQMVDALMHGGACPAVYGCSDGGWRIHTGRAWADYDERGRWWFDGSFRNAAFVLAELLQRSDTAAPAQTLSNRILVAVPTARTVTTDDGIEVTVGSKSVRWKRERNGWSLGDDLFTSDERVIEHARAMAVDAAAEAQWKLATDLSSRLKAKGIDINDPSATKRIIQEINEHYPALKCTQKKQDGKASQLFIGSSSAE